MCCAPGSAVQWFLVFYAEVQLPLKMLGFILVVTLIYVGCGLLWLVVVDCVHHIGWLWF